MFFIYLFLLFNEDNVVNVWILPEPLGSGFLSGLIPFITQMDSITSLTGPGGFCIDLTNVMSAGFKISRAARAASNAGIASAKSPLHSF